MSPQAERRWEFAWRVVASVGAIFMAGIAFSGYVKLPAQLQTVRMTVDSFRTDHSTIHQALDSLRQSQLDILCLMLAEKEGRNWLSCKVVLPRP